ncbi:5983_t:CDS:2, partial [Funneliformis caledonium]
RPISTFMSIKLYSKIHHVQDTLDEYPSLDGLESKDGRFLHICGGNGDSSGDSGNVSGDNGTVET